MICVAGNIANLAKSMLPFSDGPRNCVGMNFANANMRIVLLVSVKLLSVWLVLSS